MAGVTIVFLKVKLEPGFKPLPVDRSSGPEERQR